MKLLMGLFACFAVASAQKCGGADVTGSGGGKPGTNQQQSRYALFL